MTKLQYEYEQWPDRLIVSSGDDWLTGGFGDAAMDVVPGNW
ncbi:hypothetical protein [Cellulomonas biazotea]|nr:hypothetical protein [Cellulomonas biazotea]